MRECYTVHIPSVPIKNFMRIYCRTSSCVFTNHKTINSSDIVQFLPLSTLLLSRVESGLNMSQRDIIFTEIQSIHPSYVSDKIDGKAAVFGRRTCPVQTPALNGPEVADHTDSPLDLCPDSGAWGLYLLSVHVITLQWEQCVRAQHTHNLTCTF